MEHDNPYNLDTLPYSLTYSDSIAFSDVTLNNHYIRPLSHASNLFKKIETPSINGATFAGRLHFIIKFRCVTPDGTTFIKSISGNHSLIFGSSYGVGVIHFCPNHNITEDYGDIEFSRTLKFSFIDY